MQSNFNWQNSEKTTSPPYKTQSQRDGHNTLYTHDLRNKSKMGRTRNRTSINKST
ncbi:hypothetical protein Mal48_18190 [Thalassoglobus polymorphus]|uniref:Uncharacterized protein n=1 Tax=Thalassoglobus polymorphus TaxID=2527994 RepID=A0A517QLQ8_9PLAN|nr:hypothetical protein Mal48_18190 [Thalassoglobus polymorphus]